MHHLACAHPFNRHAELFKKRRVRLDPVSFDMHDHNPEGKTLCVNLEFKPLIDRDERVDFPLGHADKPLIANGPPVRLGNRENLVPRKRAANPRVHTFVEENTHLRGHGLDELLFRELQKSDGALSRDGWEIFEETVKSVPAFDVIE